MIIYSKPDAAVPFRLELPELPRDYWIPTDEILEAKTIATSTTSAAVFRQLVKYDVTSITARYNAILDIAKTAYLILMRASAQTSWIVNNGSGTFEVLMAFEASPLNSQKDRVSFRFSVLAEVV